MPGRAVRWPPRPSCGLAVGQPSLAGDEARGAGAPDRRAPGHRPLDRSPNVVRRASLDMSLATRRASGRSEMHFTRNTDFAAQLAIRSAI